MQRYLLFIYLITIIFFYSCNEKMTDDEIARIGIESCRKPATYISKLGFNPMRCTFSSSDLRMKGIVLIQNPENEHDTLYKKWQDPTWAQYGYMGSITTDDSGNAFCAPIPFVNNLDNNLNTVQRIYKIDHNTAKMNIFLTLPAIDSEAGISPFGILGLYFDCHAKKLYAATVGGSTQETEKGMIYVIDPSQQKITDKLNGYDAIGLFVGGHQAQKKLFFGHARSSDIYSVPLDKQGNIDGKVTTELSLDGLGPRGTDRARRIRFDKYGNLIISGIEFNYNLAAQSNKPESQYQFGYDNEHKKWVIMKIENQVFQ